MNLNNAQMLAMSLILLASAAAVSVQAGPVEDLLANAGSGDGDLECGESYAWAWADGTDDTAASASTTVEDESYYRQDGQYVEARSSGYGGSSASWYASQTHFGECTNRLPDITDITD